MERSRMARSFSGMKNIVPRSIAFNYPGFQSLPRGIKKMLVFTETFFFGAENADSDATAGHLPAHLQPAPGRYRARLAFGSSWRN